MPPDQKQSLDTLFEFGPDWQPIAPQARLIWTIAAFAVAAPFLVAAVVLGAVLAEAAGLAVALVVCVAILLAIRRVVVRRHRAWGYSVREDELVLRRGLLVRKLTIVPIGRMQFLDIHQGPLDRWLGVANLQLHTASVASDAKVPMLPLAGAEQLRDELTRRGAGRSGGT